MLKFCPASLERDRGWATIPVWPRGAEAYLRVGCPGQANCIRVKLFCTEPSSFLYLKGETRCGVNGPRCLSNLHKGYVERVLSQAAALFPVSEAVGRPQRQTSVSPSRKIRLGAPAAGKKVFWHIICINAK